MRRISKSTSGTFWGLLAVVVGILVIVLPIHFLGLAFFESGPIAAFVIMVEVVLGLVGLGIAGTGIYSYRTGNQSPAIAAIAMICSLTIVFRIIWYIEIHLYGLVPIWLWVSIGLLTLTASLWLTYQFTPPRETTSS
ncbi:hypothetical protein BV210_17710 (plasmid) [Halorientalis sp. IM1011]|uniref:hypothetical protein n=1 Tax=Halorientalis sp. IM1011 TaxID=1932360 RepID=UPI00097CCE3A|nr:hypothetical protein [Halorientalis sp. IM1011]AQL44610.1 hypothetical protein BV210_17710 [Halorientalis sp. IM1011]